MNPTTSRAAHSTASRAAHSTVVTAKAAQRSCLRHPTPIHGAAAMAMAVSNTVIAMADGRHSRDTHRRPSGHLSAAGLPSYRQTLAAGLVILRVY